MQTDVADASAAPAGRIALALTAGGVPTAAWVGLTIQTGLTYHLAPGVIAALPGYALAWSLERPPSRMTMVLTALGGIGLVAAGWLALELKDAVPTATFVDNQPGGVQGEMVAFMLLGSAFAVRAMLRIHRNE